MERIFLVFFCFLLIAGCDKEPGLEVDPPLTFSIQEYVDALVTEEDTSVRLSAEAVKESGVYDKLTENEHPLLLILFDGEGVLETYLASQGLTEESFLAHPKLAQFVNSHLIYDDVDIYTLRGEIGATATFTSAAGTPIEITTVKSSEGGAVKGSTANGVPLQLWCAEGGALPPPDEGFVCFADGPIVSDFDWSQ
ncbi:MAG: hypothetical protein ACRCYY_07345 [Trueperaceae bacterium]